jgi:NADPH:quinone reductase-like Zn-dependent oxidoreductase
MQIQHYGAATNLQLEDVVLPHVGSADIRIHVAATGVNPIDWKVRSGAMSQAMHFPMPLTLGWECAGVVDDVGVLVKNFKPGDRVYAMAGFNRGGTYAEYVVVDAAEVALMPRDVSFSVAAGLPMTAQAAWSALETAGLQSGQKVLIHGGAGGVGSIAIQLAKARGAHVTTTVASNDMARASELGADVVIDFTRQNFAEQVQGMDAVVDTIGGPTQEASWATLKPGGILVALTQPPAMGRAEAAGVRGQAILTQPRGEVLQEITKLIDDGKLQPLPTQAYPLTDAAKVHENGEARRLAGRTVLTVSEH